jgi:hypothetical protein
LWMSAMVAEAWGGSPQAPRAPQAPPVEDNKVSEVNNCHKAGCNSKFCECGDDCHCHGRFRCSESCRCGRLRDNTQGCNCGPDCTCGCQEGLECTCHSTKQIKVSKSITSYSTPVRVPMTYGYQGYVQPVQQSGPYWSPSPGYSQPVRAMSRRGGSC